MRLALAALLVVVEPAAWAQPATSEPAPAGPATAAPAPEPAPPPTPSEPAPAAPAPAEALPAAASPTALVGKPAAAAKAVLGLEAGFSLTSFNGPAIDNSTVLTSQKLGGVVAGFVRYRIDERWGLRGELALSDRGAHFENAGMAADAHYYYLDVPVLAELAFAGGPVVPRLSGGLAMSVLFRADTVAIGSAVPVDSQKRWDLSLVLGAGLSVPDADGGEWTVDLRLLGGLVDLNSASAQAAHGNGVMLLGGFGF